MSRKEVSFSRCIIPPKSTSLAGMHPELKEIWICRSGECELWRKEKEQGKEYTIKVLPGDDFILTPETHFQLRNQSSEDVDFIIATLPRWPDDNAWQRVKDYWPTENK
jgi:mannose-6-phosphate isomerase-like protein (cupin superfamily)